VDTVLHSVACVRSWKAPSVAYVRSWKAPLMQLVQLKRTNLTQIIADDQSKAAFYLMLATLAIIICLCLTFDRKQGWNNSTSVASVKWNAA